MATSSLEERLIALESFEAHRAREFEELSGELARQAKEVEQLRRQVQDLQDRLNQAEGALDSLLPEPPPPHY